MKTKVVTIQSYAWKAGSSPSFKHFDPAVLGEELNKIKEREGVLKPVNIVEAARDPESPLHGVFPWDDAEAAQIGREAIAARLVRSINVRVVVDKSDKPIDTRAFVSTKDPNAKGNRSYVGISHALEDEEGRAWLLRQAWLELRSWKRRYSELSELASVFDVIESVQSKAA